MLRWLNCRGGAAGRIASLLLVLLVGLAPLPALADGLFGTPNLGMPAPALPRATPPPKSGGMPALDADQCLLAAGSCPTGRLQRSGGRCYCVSGGTARQGTTRTKPQNARPPVDPP